MPVELVYEPHVEVIAHTMIDPSGMARWASAHGLAEVAENLDTPLGNLSYLARNAGYDAPTTAALDALPEFGGRFCYRSWAAGRGSAEYIANIIEMEHGSVLHHSTVSFAISGVSRSLSHELVRHHTGADPSQESQRYVDAKDIRFVVPPLLLALLREGPDILNGFRQECIRAIDGYRALQETLDFRLPDAPTLSDRLGTMRKKRSLEAARALLPNAAETRLLWTMNLRAARHICALRGAEGADLEIRRLAVAFTRTLKEIAPLTFADFEVVEGTDGFPATRCQHPKV